MKPSLLRRSVSAFLIQQNHFTSAAFLYRIPNHRIFPRNSQVRSNNSKKKVSVSSLMDPLPPDEDQSKWETMYAGSNEDSIDGIIDVSVKVPATEIRVITFDLDNTLWKTSKVIGAANDALSNYLDTMNIQQEKRTEVVMGELFKKDKARYAPILDDSSVSDKDVAPVYLTQLRKDAVFSICKEQNGYSDEEADNFSRDAFEVWTNARHAAIPMNFATSVIACMNQIREMKTSSGHPVIVGAITDGNSNPLIVPELETFFDFCVNAESVGLSKPDRKIYETAVEIVAKMEIVSDIFGDSAGNESENKLTKDLIEDLVGPWWVHIGDHFMKDIVAAKGMNMRTIWARELILPQKEAGSETKSGSEVNLKNVDEFVKEISKMEVIQMSIGAEDFLVNSMEREFADAVVNDFEGIPKSLFNWHEVGLIEKRKRNDEIALAPDNLANSDLNEILTVVMPEEVGAPNDGSPSPPAEEVSEMKFCVYCGSKLPIEANFCSSCGNKQPQL